MNEWLFLFSAEPFFIPFFKTDITEFERDSSACWEKWPLQLEVSASPMIWKSIHRGTKVKASTYFAMQIRESFAEVFVIIDI